MQRLAGAPSQTIAVGASGSPELDPVEATYASCVASPDALGVRVFDDGGFGRTVYVDATGLDRSGPRPLLLAFHGWGGDPEQLERTSGIVAAATARGWVVARPLGIGKSFNAGSCCGDAASLGVDDVGFARRLVARLVREQCVDPRRVYATGFSNGGFLSHRLGCEAADRFTAIASVAGTFGFERCMPSRPVPVLHIHGGKDGTVKFGGTPARGWSSVATVIDAWSRADRCDPDGAVEVFANGGARCVRNGSCASGSEVVLCRDDQAAHTWPGGPNSVGWGGSQDLDATSYVLDFLARQTR